MNTFWCGIPGCSFTFRNGSDHLSHLVSDHGYACTASPAISRSISHTSSPSTATGPSAPPVDEEEESPTVIFQDPTQEHDIYISYCESNCRGGAAFVSRYHDPNMIAAHLSKTFKPWVASVCLGPAPSGDFYQDRALYLQKVKVFIPLISPEFSANDQCKMEYQFALNSLKKPVLPVIIAPGKINGTIDSYIAQEGRVPFRLDGAITDDAEFNEKMGYLTQAVKALINSVTTDRETHRLQQLSLHETGETSSGPVVGRLPSYEQVLSMERAKIGQDIQERVPKVGDHVIAHWLKHSYFTATIVRFLKESMRFEIRWDDQDESGRYPDITMVALDKVPERWEVSVGARVFFPQGRYTGQEGVRTGGGRFHEGEITRTEAVSGGRLRCYGHHLKGERDGKWVTYKDYAYEFCCFLDEIRVAPNPYDVLHAYSGSN